MTVTRGDIVLVRFPFASGTGSKVRPALVVQSDRNNVRLANTIVVQITTNVSRVGEPTQLLVEPSSPDGRSSGLISASAISCENIATVDHSLIVRTIGHLPATMLQLVDNCLKAALGL
jgi:mRNA interferase MazF